MKFFCDFFYKFKNYFILFSCFIFLIIINDIFLCLILRNKNDVQAVKEEVIYEPSLSLNDEESSSTDNVFKVDLKGEVKKPGVYEATTDMNVFDLINKAGGLTKKAVTDNINLSKKLNDQMVIIVPKKSQKKQIDNCSCPNEITTTQNKQEKKEVFDSETITINNDAEIKSEEVVNDSSINSNDTKLISINTASLDELKTIPGIGDSKAQSIIEYRQTSRFNSIEDIKNVSGIGDALFEKIKDYISV